jgi:hypothetical protein
LASASTAGAESCTAKPTPAALELEGFAAEGAGAGAGVFATSVGLAASGFAAGAGFAGAGVALDAAIYAALASLATTLPTAPVVSSARRRAASAVARSA